MYELCNSCRGHQNICYMPSRSEVPREWYLISCDLTVGAECLSSQAAPADSGLETERGGGGALTWVREVTW